MTRGTHLLDTEAVPKWPARRFRSMTARTSGASVKARERGASQNRWARPKSEAARGTLHTKDDLTLTVGAMRASRHADPGFVAMNAVWLLFLVKRSDSYNTYNC